MMLSLAIVLALTMLSAKPAQASGTIVAVPETNAAALVAEVISPSGGAVVSNAVLNGHSQCAGFFKANVDGVDLPAEGLILSSGTVSAIQGPNDSDSTTGSF